MPTVAAPVVSGITAGDATLTTTVDPVFTGGNFSYRYGPTTAYGASTPPAPLLSGVGAQAALATLAALTPSTTYHVQLVLTLQMAQQPRLTSRSPPAPHHHHRGKLRPILGEPLCLVSHRQRPPSITSQRTLAASSSHGNR
jgi:hypothetical protein